MKTKNIRFNSKLIHSSGIEDNYGSATTPIYQTSTFAFRDCEHGAKLFAGEEEGYIYTRIGNPTITAFENVMSELEGGYRAIATSSGMGAVNVAYLTFLTKGDHIISTDAVYGPSRVVIENYYNRYGIESSYVDTSDISNIEKVLRPNSKMLYIETPANPTMAITDIKKCSLLAKKHNLILVVDNTFCSPFLQKPLNLGADITLHSITKFINGHADVVGGVLIAKDKDIYHKLRATMVNFGFNMDPHQAYMVIRGLKTLSIRMERSQQNAMIIAEYLSKHPKVEWVKYPGLKSFSQYELAQEQMSGPGGMISFELKGGYDAGKNLLNNVKLALLAVSLGGVETLIQHPASMTHSKVSKENRIKAGITDGLIRYSVGIEDVNDLLEDLKQALGSV